MDTNIGFDKGIHLDPSIGDDGELTECVNLTPGAGGLRTVPQGEEVVNVGEGRRLEAVHVIPETGETHYIVSYRSSLDWGRVERGYHYESIDGGVGEEQQGGGDEPGGGGEPSGGVSVTILQSAPTQADIAALDDDEIAVWIENVPPTQEQIDAANEGRQKPIDPYALYISYLRAAKKTADRNNSYRIDVSYILGEWSDDIQFGDMALTHLTIDKGEASAQLSCAGFLHYKEIRGASVTVVPVTEWWTTDYGVTAPTQEQIEALGDLEVAYWLSEEEGSTYFNAAKQPHSGYAVSVSAVYSVAFDADAHGEARAEIAAGSSTARSEAVIDPDFTGIENIYITARQDADVLAEAPGMEIPSESEQGGETTPDGGNAPDGGETEHCYLAYFLKAEEGSEDISVRTFCRLEDEPLEIRTMGNTLVILTKKGVEYALWKEGQYLALGQKPGQTKIAFSLSGLTVVQNAGTPDGSATQALYLTEWDPAAGSGAGAWCDPIKASGENTSDAAGTKVAVFTTEAELMRARSDDEQHYPSLFRYKGTAFMPSHWHDTIPETFWGNPIYYMIGTLQSGGTVDWGNGKNIKPFADDGVAALVSSSAPTLSADVKTNRAVPAGWSRRPRIAGEDSPIEIQLTEADGYYSRSFTALAGGTSQSFLLREEDRTKVSTAVMGQVAQWVRRGEKAGRFCYPFLVRYAYRMSDGSHIMHSAPVMMVPNSTGQPIVSVHSYDPDTHKIKVFVGGPQMELEINKLIVPKDIEDWKDIITGIDVFVTQQVYNYNPEGEVSEISKENELLDNAWMVGELSNLNATSLNAVSKYRKASFVSGSGNGFSGTGLDDRARVGYMAMPSLISEDADPSSTSQAERERYEAQAASEGKFYLYRHYTLDGLGDGGRDTIKCGPVDADSGVLENITVQEVMDDDYYSHDTLTGGTGFVYNNRLSLARIERGVFRGWAPNWVESFREEDLRVGTGWIDRSGRLTSIYIHIKDEGGEIVVKMPREAWTRDGSPLDTHTGVPEYLFYPNPKAYKAIMRIINDARDTVVEIEVRMREHKALNGAYWMRGLLADEEVKNTYVYQNPDGVIMGEEDSETEERTLAQPHTLMTSKVDNPFTFKADGVSTVGAGEIRAITTTTKALSPGQRGQTPLYAFCSDGIWDLHVGETGLYTTVNPVSRDVCENVKSIVAIESAVLFGTAQGLKLLAGEDTMLLSAAMDGVSDAEDELFTPSDTGTFSMASWAAAKAGGGHWEGMYGGSYMSLRQALAECSAVYDYANRIVHFPALRCSGRHYIYNVESREFSCAMGGSVAAVVNGYPESVVQYEDGRVMRFTHRGEDRTELRSGLIVTRPVCFGDATAMKMLEDLRIIYRSMNAGTGHKVAVYVSNDRRRWMPLGSMRRHSYKWYRFVVLTRQTDADTLEGMVCRTQPRRTGKLR